MVNKWWRVETGHSRWTWLFGGCNVVMGINTIAIFRIAWNWASIKHRIDKLPFMSYFQKIPAKSLLVCSWWLSTKKYSNTWWNLTSWIYVYCNVQKLIFLTHFSINQNYWFWHIFFLMEPSLFSKCKISCKMAHKFRDCKGICTYRI